MREYKRRKGGTGQEEKVGWGWKEEKSRLGRREGGRWENTEQRGEGKVSVKWTYKFFIPILKFHTDTHISA